MSSNQKTTTTLSASADATAVFQRNEKKMKELAEQAHAVKIGGKGTARRKKKVIHRQVTLDDKKLQSSLRKLAANNIPGIEEVNMFKDNGEVIHFTNPKVQSSPGTHTFAISGPSDTKSLQDMLPTLMSQMGMNTTNILSGDPEGNDFITRGDQQNLNSEQTAADGDDEVPDLVENFDTVSDKK